MKINLLSLAVLVLMLCLITMVMNFLKRVLLKALFLLKALLMQIPPVRRMSLQAALMERESARPKRDRGKLPELRKPKLLLEEEAPEAEENPKSLLRPEDVSWKERERKLQAEGLPKNPPEDLEAEALPEESPPEGSPRPVRKFPERRSRHQARAARGSRNL